MLRIIGVYARLDAVDHLAARTRNITRPVLVCKQRSGFRHAVAHRVVQADTLEPLLNLRIERGTAHDICAYLTAESRVKPRPHFVENDLVDSRNGSKHTDIPLAQHRLEGGLVDLLHHERHGAYHVRLHILHGLQEQGRCRSLAEIVDGAAAGERIEELVHHPVDMGHREHGYECVTRVDEDMLVAVFDGRAEVAVSEHHSLRSACGAGGIVDHRKVGEIVGREGYVVRRETGGISLVKIGIHVLECLLELRIRSIQERKVIDIDRTLELRHGGLVKFLPNLLVSEEKDTV